jgi:hypothetical protein
VDQPRIDHVVVIEDQRHLIGKRLELVEESRHHALTRNLSWGLQERKDPLSDTHTGALQSGHHVAPEPNRVAIVGIQGEPCNGPRHPVRPVGEQSGLAETSRRAHEGQFPDHRLVEGF